MNVNYKLTVDEINSVTRSLSKEGKFGTHVALNNFFFEKISSVDCTLAMDFNNQVGRLKKERVKADYGGRILNYDDYRRSEILQTEILKILSKKYYDDMTPNTFIIDRMNSLTDEFPKIACKFEFDELSDSYYMEVLPKVSIDENKALKMTLFCILKEFISYFPHESLVFFTQGEGVDIKTPCHIVYGKKYFSWKDGISAYLQGVLESKPIIKDHEAKSSGILSEYYLAS